jgi:hypothetical protein
MRPGFFLSEIGTRSGVWPLAGMGYDADRAAFAKEWRRELEEGAVDSRTFLQLALELLNALSRR